MSNQILECGTCHTRYNVSRFQPGTKLICARCKSIFQVPKYHSAIGAKVASPVRKGDDSLTRFTRVSSTTGTGEPAGRRTTGSERSIAQREMVSSKDKEGRTKRTRPARSHAGIARKKSFPVFAVLFLGAFWIAAGIAAVILITAKPKEFEFKPVLAPNQFASGKTFRDIVGPYLKPTECRVELVPPGRKLEKFEDILTLSDDEIDFAKAWLLISEEIARERDGRVVDTEWTLAQLDEWIAELRPRVEAAPTPKEKIYAIIDFLYKEKDFRTQQTAWDPNNLFFDLVIEGRQAYCLGFSCLWLSITERLGLPVYGVFVPRHIFLRYDDGVERFNIETLHTPWFPPGARPANAPTPEPGKSYDDEYYIKTYGVEQAAIDNGVYMKNCDKKEVLAGVFHNRAGMWLEKAQDPRRIETDFGGDVKAAYEAYRTAAKRELEDYMWVTKLAPDSAMTLSLRAMSYIEHQRDYEAALADMDKAVNVNPCAHTYAVRSYVHLHREKYDEALKDAKQALKMKPGVMGGHELARYVMIYAYLGKRNFEKAGKMCHGILSTYPHSPDNRYAYGMIFHEQKRYDRALAEFVICTMLSKPESDSGVYANTYAGLIYQAKGEIQKAEECYRRAIANNMKWSNASVAQAYNGLGEILMTRGQYEEAIRNFEVALLFDPKLEKATKNLDEAKERVGKQGASVPPHLGVLQTATAKVKLHLPPFVKTDIMDLACVQTSFFAPLGASFEGYFLPTIRWNFVEGGELIDRYLMRHIIQDEDEEGDEEEEETMEEEEDEEDEAAQGKKAALLMEHLDTSSPQPLARGMALAWLLTQPKEWKAAADSLLARFDKNRVSSGGDVTEMERETALYTFALFFGKVKHEKAIRVLIKKLNDKSWLVRAGSCDALRIMDNRSKMVISALVKALDDSDETVRGRAASALGKLLPERNLKYEFLASPEEQQQVIEAWKKWWQDNERLYEEPGEDDNSKKEKEKDKRTPRDGN